MRKTRIKIQKTCGSKCGFTRARARVLALQFFGGNMSRWPQLVSAALVLSCVGACGPHAARHRKQEEVEDPLAPRVVTPSGAIRGSWMKTRRERAFQAFRGIRYAEPPVGELRFELPVPIRHYDDEVDATSEGPICPQPADSSEVDIREDCLMLNVYTPQTNSSQLLPVIVYVHGGGFIVQSGSSSLAGPHYLLERDLVLVTFNYRLGLLGFLVTGDALAPGNNGLKDQVAALLWVQRNIAAFGGDPARVTLAGHGVGGISVGLHLLSPMSRGLFHGAMAMSGSPLPIRPDERRERERAVQHSAREAARLGCPTNTTRLMLDCLRTIDYRLLGKSMLDSCRSPVNPLKFWSPVVEEDFGQERFVPREPQQALLEGRALRVPCVVGRTRDEFFWLGNFLVLTLETKNGTLRNWTNNEWDNYSDLRAFLPDLESWWAVRELRVAYLRGDSVGDSPLVRARLGRLYSDAIVGFPVHRMADLLSRHSPRPVYYYEFSYVGNYSHFDDPVTNKPIGVIHQDDVIYLFTNPHRFPAVPLDSPENKLVERMTAIFYNFARYGDPNGAAGGALGVHWPALRPARGDYLRVGSALSVHQRLFHDLFSVWEDLYPLPTPTPPAPETPAQSFYDGSNDL